MRDILINIAKKVTIGLLICIMGMLLINKALFTHSHIMADGTLICHSHPFDKSKESESGKPHHHTSLEFLLIHNTEVLFFMALVAITLHNLVRKFDRVSFLFSNYWSSYIIPQQGRAPPQL